MGIESSKSLILGISLVAVSAVAAMTPRESEEINRRLSRFYSSPNDAGAMNLPTPKTRVRTGEKAILNPSLRTLEKKQPHALWDQAQAKLSDSFRRYQCQHGLRRAFPGLDCESRSARAQIEASDQVEDLASSWTNYITFKIDEIPSTGRSDRPLWSDDYWAMRLGLTSYRYSEGADFENYAAAVRSYFQPREFLKLVGWGDWATKTVRWSPAEKYDLTVGDTRFTLTNEQKDEGKESLGPDGDVEEWMGLCHGWAPASIMVDRPLRPVTVMGPGGRPVEWYPNDIKAMLTLAYSNGNYPYDFIGGRCDVKKPEAYPNGRLKDEACFDNNPATFHLALANLIGREKASFVMDKTFDYEVWNQPVVGYEFTYFNPRKPSLRSRNWKKVAVDYDADFKAQDRFQTPLTRGKIATGPANLRARFRRGGGDSEVRQVVGVIAEVVWLAEIDPEHTTEVQPDELVREIYTYDLELGEDGGVPVILGGEWHDNNHPDFLFVPRKGTFVHEKWDQQLRVFDGSVTPSAEVERIAREASFAEGYPLCAVVKYLVRESTGKDSISCP